MKSITKQLYNHLGNFDHFNYHFPIKLLKRNNYFTKSDVRQWYKTLGLPENSDQEAVRVSYIELVKRFHPDSKGSEADADKFQEIECAYRNLQDKFSKERFNKDDCEGEYGLYHQEKEPEEQEIDHTAPQHRQYLSYGGYGFGTPSQRQKQFAKHRAEKAVENVTTYRINKIQDGDSKSLIIKENRKKIKDSRVRVGIDKLVEDLIQESMGRGEFDNLPGSGKPLKNLQKTHNPYVDFVTHKMNEVLIENGVAPAWINLQKEISEDKEKIKSTLLKFRKRIGPIPLSPEEQIFWDETKCRLENDVKVLNTKIDNYNLVVPLLTKQQFHFNLNKEAEKILKDGKFSA